MFLRKAENGLHLSPCCHMLLHSFLLFVITFAGGSLPLVFRSFTDKRTDILLAFSGSFLLCITLLHLLPETFEHLDHHAGIYVLAGFFLQMIIQRLTHGVEHGHSHIHVEGHGHAHGSKHHEHEHTLHVPLISIVGGLAVHAFMEGIPLGFDYSNEVTESSLYLAVAAHKLPEAMLLTSLMTNVKGKIWGLWTLLIFSLITPMAGFLADVLGTKYLVMNSVVTWIIPIVAGAFIHIATTIFFESGTQQHAITGRKIIAIGLGLAIGLTTMLFE